MKKTLVLAGLSLALIVTGCAQTAPPAAPIGATPATPTVMPTATASVTPVEVDSQGFVRQDISVENSVRGAIRATVNIDPGYEATVALAEHLPDNTITNLAYFGCSVLRDVPDVTYDAYSKAVSAYVEEVAFPALAAAGETVPTASVGEYINIAISGKGLCPNEPALFRN